MSCFCNSSFSNSNLCNLNTYSNRQVKLTTERIKVLKVKGEKVAQVVVEGTIPINAIKIDRIVAEVRDLTDHVFRNKVVKQGTIHKQIFYVDPYRVVKEIEENIPFMVAVDIPGIERTPFTDVQNHLLDIDTDYSLTPASDTTPGTLMQKVVAHILVKVSEWTQMDVVTGVDLFPKVSTATSTTIIQGRNEFSPCDHRFAHNNVIPKRDTIY